MKIEVKVCDCFKAEKGLVVGVVNKDLNNIDNAQIIKMFKGPIRVDKIDLNVVDVQITTSMWGGKNIFLLIEEPIDVDDIKIGTYAYKDII